MASAKALVHCYRSHQILSKRCFSSRTLSLSSRAITTTPNSIIYNPWWWKSPASDLSILESPYLRMRRDYFSSRSPPQKERDVVSEDDGTSLFISRAQQDMNNSPISDQDPPFPGEIMLQDKSLPCGDHLDRDGKILPKSDWIEVIGTLPTGSLNQIVKSIHEMLMEEEEKGIIDLDADWNPFQDAIVPLVSLEEISANQSIIQAAHVRLSPFGRPTGWLLKLANRSLVYSILSRGEQDHLRVAWKVVRMEEYKYSREREEKEDPAFTHNDGLIVDDTMVRIENGPVGMDENYVRYILSRYDLAHEGNTVLRWKGKTNDGKVAPLLFIVRFASASWARAAIRELQSTVVNGRPLRLVQYPNQIRYNGESASC